MKTKTITLYSFDELSDQAKKKALQNLWDCNVDHEWWDFVYDDFHTIAGLLGIDVDLKETYFTGFAHQGQGSAFTADVDVLKLVNGIKTEAWKEHAPKENFSFPAVTPNIERICKLIAARKIDFSVWVEPVNRETAITVDNETHVYNNKVLEPANVFAAMDDLTDLIESVCKILNRWFFKQLENESEYLQSDEAIIETIKANGWTFKENGELENL